MLKRWEEIPCSWIEKISIVKMVVLSKAVCRFNNILYQNLVAILKKIELKLPKFVWNHKDPNREYNSQKRE